MISTHCSAYPSEVDHPSSGKTWWAMVKNCFILLHPFGEHLVCCLFEKHIGTLLPKKVPEQKATRYQENRQFVIIYY